MKSYSLTQIREELSDLNQNNHDAVTPLSNIRTGKDGQPGHPDRLVITDIPWWGPADGEMAYDLTGTATRDLLTRISFPQKFWNFLPGRNLRVARDNLADLVMARTKGDVMVRANGQELYGILSSSYERINHDWVVEQLWENEVASDFHIVDYRASRDRLVIKAIQKSIKNVKDVGVGFTLTNSMSGHAALDMRAYVCVLACTNGMILPKSYFGTDLHMVHRGRSLSRGLLAPPTYKSEKFGLISDEITDLLLRARQEGMVGEVERLIERAKEVHVSFDGEEEAVANAIRFGRQLGLTQGEQELYSKALLMPGHGGSRWGYVQAATWMAHEEPIAGTDRQEVIEAAAWNVLVA
jgi:hypothetical protein